MYSVIGNWCTPEVILRSVDSVRIQVGGCYNSLKSYSCKLNLPTTTQKYRSEYCHIQTKFTLLNHKGQKTPSIMTGIIYKDRIQENPMIFGIGSTSSGHTMTKSTNDKIRTKE